MRSVVCSTAIALVLLAATAGIARAATIDGVIVSYDSGNQGTDMVVRTSSGKTVRMWFDNMKKPMFQGKQLPWCPEMPCNGWPKQLVLNKTNVRIYAFSQSVSGTTVLTPTKIELRQ